jgi:hypothetical protein
MNGFTAKYGRLGEVNPVVTPISFNALRLRFRLVARDFPGIVSFSTAIDLAL